MIDSEWLDRDMSIKLVAVGDDCNRLKTKLLFTYVDRYPEEYVPTVCASLPFLSISLAHTLNARNSLNPCMHNTFRCLITMLVCVVLQKKKKKKKQTTVQRNNLIKSLH